MKYDEKLFKQVIEFSVNAFAYHKIITDSNNRPVDYEYVDINSMFEQFTGLTREKVIGRRIKELIPDIEHDDINWIEFYGVIASGGPSAVFEQYSHAFGRWYLIHAFSPERGYFVTNFTDITTLKQRELELINKNNELTQLYEEIAASEEELRQQMHELSSLGHTLADNERRLNRAQSMAQVGNWEIDLQKKIMWASDEAFHLYGLEQRSSMLPLIEAQKVVDKADRSKMDLALENLIEKGAEYNVEFKIHRADNGKEQYMHSIAEVQSDQEGNPVKVLGVIQNISERIYYQQSLERKNEELTSLYEEIAASEEELKQQLELLHAHEKKIRHMAYHDELTNLPNRAAFLEKLTSALAMCRRNGNKAGVVFLDLDDFKKVNDTLGHAFGDRLLIEVAKRIEGCLRDYDLVARLGGDEFLLLFQDLYMPDDIHAVIKRINLSFEDAFDIGGNLINITVTMGVAIFPDDGDNPDELMKNADTAMYRAKDMGKNGYLLFNDHMREEFMKKIRMERLLRQALIHDEFVLYYQPQFYGKTKKLRGFEALIRWNNQELGLVSPMDFIPASEETGLIVPIGEWVINKACQLGKRIIDEYQYDFKISVNISTIQLRQKKFYKTVLKALNSSGLSPENLELEVTESIFIDNYEQAVHTLKKLQEAGISIALDDFGTGYSSLSYLRKLPINLLKIDKIFIHEIGRENPHNTITDSIISLVKKLNIQTLAEGVESKDQWDFLINCGCDYIQGYYSGKPSPEDQLGQIIGENLHNQN